MAKPKFRASEQVLHTSGVPMRVIRLIGQTPQGENVYQTISKLESIYEVYESNLKKISRKGKVVA